MKGSTASMSKGPWKNSLRPTVVRRLLNIIQSSGLAVDRIEYAPDGRLVIVPRDATSASTIEARPTDKKDEWEV
jgi:hypothetical protein